MPPVFSFAIKVNGTDVATYSMLVAELRGWWDTAQLGYGEIQLADRAWITTVPRPLLQPLDITVAGNISCTSPSSMETNLNALKGLLVSSSAITLIGGNDSARQRTGYYIGPMKVTPYPSMAQASVEFTVRCMDPLQYDVSDTTVSGASGADLTCALATYLVRPVITVTAPTSPLTITYKNASGTTIGSPLQLTFTGSPTIVVDDFFVTAGGVRHDEYVTGGDAIVLNPQDGVSPKVNVSSGSAVSIVYKKAYL